MMAFAKIVVVVFLSACFNSRISDNKKCQLVTVSFVRKRIVRIPQQIEHVSKPDGIPIDENRPVGLRVPSFRESRSEVARTGDQGGSISLEQLTSDVQFDNRVRAIS